MNPQTPKIKFSKKWYNIRVRYIIAYFVGIITIPILLKWPIVSVGGVMVPILFFIYLGLTSEKWVNAQKNQQFPENLDIKTKDHDAFIIIHSMGSFSAYSYIGLDILIPYYIQKKYPFKIYHCYNPHEFLDVLKNDKAKYLWIIGHGWRGGITFKWVKSLRERFSHKPKRTLFPYAKIRDNLNKFPKKSFIAQLHCNHFDNTYTHNESLVEILLDSFEDSNYYITDGLSHVLSNWLATRDLVSQCYRISIPESEIQKDLEPDNGGCSWIHLI